MFILGIDPGNMETAYVLIDEVTLIPFKTEKIRNRKLLRMIYGGLLDNVSVVAIEIIASYGMSVGKSVFDTCIWIGRFVEAMKNKRPDLKPYPISRKDEKMNICYSMKANDKTIKIALADRFAGNATNHGKGTKSNPGFFYGFSVDMWSAFAIAVTCHDMYLKEGVKNDNRKDK